MGEEIEQFTQKYFFKNLSHLNRTWNFSFMTLAADVGVCYNLFDIIELFHIYYIPFIICIGLIGNILSCFVFLNTHLKMRSSSYYLAALSTADFGFLVALLFVWLNDNIGVQVFNKDGWCQSLVYISSVCSFLSVWLIVAFTVERFIAVQYPLHKPHMCTVRRAKAVVSMLTIIALISHSYSFITAGTINVDGTDTCELREGYHETMRIINMIDSIFTLLLPLVLIIIMNTMIMRNLIRFSRRFREENANEENNQKNEIPLNQMPSSSSRFQSKAQNSVVSEANEIRNDVMKKHHPRMSATRTIYSNASAGNPISTKTQQNITKMLLVISSVFILLNLPSYVIRLYIFLVFSFWNQKSPDSLWCLQQFFMLLYYTNFSINFLLYSMYGITFRKCLWQLIKKKVINITGYVRRSLEE